MEMTVISRRNLTVKIDRRRPRSGKGLVWPQRSWVRRKKRQRSKLCGWSLMGCLGITRKYWVRDRLGFWI
uniref:Uncharacterized protein n=1 Tax=Cannabis sativa TaxID=3483 RepID=A0A803RBT4_CANSA